MITISTSPLLKQNPFRDFDSLQQSKLPILLSPEHLYPAAINCSQSRFISCSLTNNRHRNQNQEAMKVHPMPKKRNNITIQYYINNTTGNNISHQRDPSSGVSHKKLRRLPHIFSRVLELPFRSDADVSVEENPDCFRFVAETDNIGDVRAHTIEIHPGVTKIVIRPNGYLELSSLDDLELDMWRFRLPESTRPELASAVLIDGELIVTVPKGDELEEEGNGNNGEFRGGS
ncbi:hypothetical protein MANES_03G177300v8 [Manihot esculenta]|uniref:SHSP domain-containing protein n=1 Tax=Manihot esculenta TaxID=3983 RepID=A0A2C9WA26_MANES|nr:hypothetical protein MANES_03G177300v8 [Manihot esculenta]